MLLVAVMEITAQLAESQAECLTPLLNDGAGRVSVSPERDEGSFCQAR